jgi:hypothetical protein
MRNLKFLREKHVLVVSEIEVLENIWIQERGSDRRIEKIFPAHNIMGCCVM